MKPFFTTGMPQAVLKYRLFTASLAGRTFFTRLAVCIGLLSVSCIERNNDFDPIRDREEHKTASVCSMDTLHSRRDAINAVLVHTDSIANQAQQLFQSFGNAAQSVFDHNTEIENANRGIAENNQTIEMNNGQQSSSGLLEFKTTLTELDTFVSLNLYEAAVVGITMTLAFDSTMLVSILPVLGSMCPEYADSVEELDDSTWAAFARATEPIRTYMNSKPMIEKFTDSSNQAIQDRNFAIYLENGRIAGYNDSIYKRQWIDRMDKFPLITNGDTLKVHCENAQAGDTIVFEGTLTVNGNLNFNGIHGTPTNHIALIGSPLFTDTLYVPSGIFLTSCEYIDISNFCIRQSSTSGLKLENWSNNITLKNCTIEGNNGFGLEVVTSGMTVTNCRIFNNGGGGIFFHPSPTGFKLNLDNVLIVNNYGIGLDLITPKADLKFVTISNNDSDGINIASPTNGDLSIYNSIVSFNRGFGISHQDDGGLGTAIQLVTVDFYGNASGNLSPGISGTFNSVDPNFNDTLNSDYSIAPSGDIYTFETKQNIIIGYRYR
jgi:hypothetical protein